MIEDADYDEEVVTGWRCSSCGSVYENTRPTDRCLCTVRLITDPSTWLPKNTYDPVPVVRRVPRWEVAA